MVDDLEPPFEIQSQAIDYGILSCDENKAFAHLKSIFAGMEKRIYLPDEVFALKTIIQESDISVESWGDVRSHAYMMLDADGNELAIAKPGCAEDGDPVITDRPICRLPWIDHAGVMLLNKSYDLIMQNRQTYILADLSGYIAARFTHRGLSGGWYIDDPFSRDFVWAFRLVPVHGTGKHASGGLIITTGCSGGLH